MKNHVIHEESEYSQRVTLFAKLLIFTKSHVICKDPNTWHESLYIEDFSYKNNFSLRITSLQE